MEPYYQRFYKFKDDIETLYTKKKELLKRIKENKNEINKSTDELYQIKEEISGINNEINMILGKTIILDESLTEVFKNHYLYLIVLSSIMFIVFSMLLALNLINPYLIFLLPLVIVLGFIIKTKDHITLTYKYKLKVKKDEKEGLLKDLKANINGLEKKRKEKVSYLNELKKIGVNLNKRVDTINDHIEANHSKLIKLNSKTEDLLNSTTRKSKIFNELITFNRSLNKFCKNVKEVIMQ